MYFGLDQIEIKKIKDISVITSIQPSTSKNMITLTTSEQVTSQREDPLYECNFDIDSCNSVYTNSIGSTTKYDFRIKTTEIIVGENYYITDYTSVC